MTYPAFHNRNSASELLKLGIPLDKFLRAAPWEADAHAAVLVIPFHADHRANAILRVANLLPQ
jgi:hypothetical protein